MELGQSIRELFAVSISNVLLTVHTQPRAILRIAEGTPKTDPSEIEALIKRLNQSNLEPRDAHLVERLLRLVLSMASLLQHKNASIKRLKRLIVSLQRASLTSCARRQICSPKAQSWFEDQPFGKCDLSIGAVISSAAFVALSPPIFVQTRTATSRSGATHANA